MEPEVFKLIMARFDANDKLTKECTEALKDHVKTDNQVHAVVERHATYWKFLFMGLPVVGGLIATKLGWK